MLLTRYPRLVGHLCPARRVRRINKVVQLLLLLLLLLLTQGDHVHLYGCLARG